MFVASETKPDRAAIFRRIGRRNVAFKPEDRRDLRCYGSSRMIWLPHDKSIKELLGTTNFNKVYETNEYFARASEYASAYMVIEPTRSVTRDPSPAV
jgi:hypothetical protein